MMKLLIDRHVRSDNGVAYRTWVRLVIASLAVLRYSRSRSLYGKPVPVASLAHFDWVVVVADNLDDIAPLQSAGADVFAYVGVGEVRRSLPGVIQWLLGDNRAWKTQLVDLTHEGLDTVLDPEPNGTPLGERLPGILHLVPIPWLMAGNQWEMESSLSMQGRQR